MIENTDAEQIERLNSRIVELMRDRERLVDRLQATQGRIMNARVDLDTGHTKAQVSRTLKGIIDFVDDALCTLKDSH